MMNQEFDSNAGPLQKRSPKGEQPHDFIDAQGSRSDSSHSAPRPKPAPGIDVWTVLDIVARRWLWLVIGLLLGGAGFYWVGNKLIKPKYTATGKMLRYEVASEHLKLNLVSAETFVGLGKSPDLLRRVGEQATPTIPPEKMVKQIKVEPEPDSEIVTVQVAAQSPTQAVHLLNFYMDEVVKFTRELQSREAAKLGNDYLKQQVSQLDQDLTELHGKFRGVPVASVVSNKLSEIGGNLAELNQSLSSPAVPNALIARQAERLQVALGELDDLMLRFTDLHPSVQAKKQQVAALQTQLAQASTNKNLSAVAPLMPRSARGPDSFDPELDIIRAKLLSLEDGRVQLATRLREAALYAENPPGIVRVFAPATLSTVESNLRPVKVGIVTLFGSMLGLIGMLGLIVVTEFVDNRLKTADDLRRVARLPVLTSLGDLKSMKEADRAQWAFRTWTMLQGRLSPSANHGLVCGITSSSPGEGRSTWINLLAEAASMTGFRVLTIATKPSPSHVNGDGDTPEASAHRNGSPKPTEDEKMKTSQHNGSNALTTSVLNSPGQVTEKFTGPDSQPMVHIPLPGWVWNLERRKQWGEALGEWRQIENLVILVELPPSNVPEAVLLGSNLPNMVWLADSGKAKAGETRAQLETLRHARCNLVGAVLNRQSSKTLKSRFPRWLSCLMLAGAMVASSQAQTAVESTNRFFSITHPSQRAEWQKRLTLGPGDILNFGLYGQPELARADVAVGLDGRVSYLEAQDIMASGATIDELRARVDEELGKFRRAARVLITPVTFRSKKYVMMGKVMTKGVYTLDRPITVLEAVARANGFENGLVDRNVIDLADFQRAFLMRGGKRYPLDFERLFQEGDLSQNIAVEPNDYIFFPSTNVREVYVVGEVRLPGPVTHNSSVSILSAITARGGFTDRAFKSRVLVVRGSLNRPERIIVDTKAILQGKEANFKLQPKDIIYVNSRPFIRVEELADLAATAFLQSLVTTWVGVDVVKPIQ